MKIIVMERKEKDERPEEERRDWWCVIETEEEEMLYDDFVDSLGEQSGDSREILWNRLMIHAGRGMGLCWGDDDVYGYLRPSEDHPEVGEEMIDSFGETWVRVE